TGRAAEGTQPFSLKLRQIVISAEEPRWAGGRLELGARMRRFRDDEDGARPPPRASCSMARGCAVIEEEEVLAMGLEEEEGAAGERDQKYMARIAPQRPDHTSNWRRKACSLM